MGEKIYRKNDAFHMPPLEWPEELRARVRNGMEQICAFREYERDKPFQGLDVDGFRALLDTLHFKMERQELAIEGAMTLDIMHMRHRMTDLRIVLFNEIELSIE